MLGAKLWRFIMIVCCAGAVTCLGQTKKFTITPPVFATVTQGPGIVGQPFTVTSSPASGIAFIITSSETWLKLSVNSNCSSASQSLNRTSPATNLMACIDTSLTPRGNLVDLLTVQSLDATYTGARVTVSVTSFPTGEIKTVPSAVTLTQDNPDQTIVVSLQSGNLNGSTKATFSKLEDDPQLLDEGPWFSGTSDCFDATVSAGQSCSLFVAADATQLNSTAVVGRTYSMRVIIQSSNGDRADVVVNFNYTRAVAPPLTITSGTAFGGTAGLPFNATLTATGGFPPYAWTIAGLPSGLTYNGLSGTISGTVSQPVTVQVTISVRDSAGSQAGPQQITVAIQPAATSVTQMFPHIADGQQWQTDFLLVNPNPATVTVELKFHLDNNVPSISIIGIPATNDIAGIQVPANGSVVYRTRGSSTDPFTTSGWVEVISNLPINGQALFRRHVPSNAYYEGSVPMFVPTRSFTLPYDGSSFTNGAVFTTGMAIANTDASAQARVTCNAFGSDGTLLGSGMQIATLAALQHTALILEATEPAKTAIGSGRGLLVCTSTTPVGALGLRFFGADALSSVPVF